MLRQSRFRKGIGFVPSRLCLNTVGEVGMSKIAQAVTNNSAAEPRIDASAKGQSLQLKKLTENEIRMKLDQFAKELSQARRERGEH
ncbi:MAG: hypothetical protein ACI95C_001210 [Pseudohongiellaceae bacterium]|jgi:hypothetical protein